MCYPFVFCSRVQTMRRAGATDTRGRACGRAGSIWSAGRLERDAARKAASSTAGGASAVAQSIPLASCSSSQRR
jgi:hypothetical protein